MSTDITSKALNEIVKRLNDAAIADIKTIKKGRLYPRDPRHLPAIMVFSDDESVQPLGRRGFQERRIGISVWIVLAAADSTVDYDDALGELQAAVEKALVYDIRREPRETRFFTALDLSAARRGWGDAGANTIAVTALRYIGTVHHDRGDHDKTHPQMG